MMFERNGAVRLTFHELNQLRQANARNGFAVNQIRSADALLVATVGALPLDMQSDLLAFLEGEPSRNAEHAAHPER